MKEHTLLDGWLKFDSDALPNSKLVYSTIINNTKTSIVKTNYQGEIHIFQSSMNEDGFETGVDVIRLTGDIVDIIKNKC